MGVDDKTVASVRSELESVGEIPQQDTRTGKDGKTYKARKPIRYTLIDETPEGVKALNQIVAGATIDEAREGLRRAMAIERSSMAVATEKYGSVYLGGNYSQVSNALGGWGVRVEKPDEFLPTLKEAIEVTKTGKPVLIECMCKEGFDFSRYP